ncbi:MAG: hypothetical protein COV78_00850 [Candidatus Pacebacteria bacterium CG11_big_fil_rev_8_21_14_0_20_34_55]|nr:MAG: hypothetical protein COV78_00850 [Candidatus Pacebacteria bacterium CG11_big_fil_rev_8_21_14_0_20_34_55]
MDVFPKGDISKKLKGGHFHLTLTWKDYNLYLFDTYCIIFTVVQFSKGAIAAPNLILSGGQK